MAEATPLPTLLSYALVAFTIEFDNEFEHRMPHQTTMARGTGPWLVSMVMWSNFLRGVSEEGVTAKELRVLTRTEKLALSGMTGWGYVAAGDRIRLTGYGRMALEMWGALPELIETRWAERFGADAVEELRSSLRAIVSRFKEDLPEYLPVVGYGLVSGPVHPAKKAETSAQLTVLLSQVLLAFTLEFEREWDLSLAISANVLRLLDQSGVAVRELPRLSGVSKEAIKVALGFFEKRGYARVEGNPKLARLTARGSDAKDRYTARISEIEKDWRARFGAAEADRLRKALAGLPGEALLRGIEPYPDGWRARVEKRAVLPHHPMVLHRGGYPDGS